MHANTDPVLFTNVWTLRVSYHKGARTSYIHSIFTYPGSFRCDTTLERKEFKWILGLLEIDDFRLLTAYHTFRSCRLGNATTSNQWSLHKRSTTVSLIPSTLRPCITDATTSNTDLHSAKHDRQNLLYPRWSAQPEAGGITLPSAIGFLPRGYHGKANRNMAGRWGVGGGSGMPRECARKDSFLRIRI